MNNYKRFILLSSTFLFSIILFVIIIFSVIPHFSVKTTYGTANNNQTVIIDAGHGGEDGGTVANDGTVEKYINLSIAKKLNNILLSYGYNTVMIRNGDYAIYDKNAQTIRQKKISDIRNRFSIMNNNPDAIFVSIHQNHFSDYNQNGAQTFYSKNNPESKILAQSIQDSISLNLQKENTRAVKKTGTEIYLLYHAQSVAVMVECGFMSNSQELSLLKDKEYQNKIALLIADGIIKYSQGSKNGIEK